MTLLGLTVVLYTALMLGLHLLSMRLMKGWDVKGENRIERWLPAIRALCVARLLLACGPGSLATVDFPFQSPCGGVCNPSHWTVGHDGMEKKQKWCGICAS